MASKKFHLLLFFLLLVFLSISADARPCKSLFVSFSLLRHQTLNSHDPLSDMAIIVDITEFKSTSESLFHNVGEDIFQFDLPHPRAVSRTKPQSLQELPLGFAYDFSSLRDRTKDILSVVVALLFGVGCGAITAATMYLAYSLFANRFGYRSSVYDYDDDEDDFNDDNKEDIKKMGYIKIPDDVKAAV